MREEVRRLYLEGAFSEELITEALAELVATRAIVFTIDSYGSFEAKKWREVLSEEEQDTNEPEKEDKKSSPEETEKTCGVCEKTHLKHVDWQAVAAKMKELCDSGYLTEDQELVYKGMRGRGRWYGSLIERQKEQLFDIFEDARKRQKGEEDNGYELDTEND